ncbi:hypothetical protein GCM10011511_28680 [Puia dinghuensis]|uniref:Tetratricopeptide repeat protein n=1 Tax=Puia dinghuensis TaxID=1792502 RepID=A0A8J2XTI4_9BACT|nr:hypothetical protein GCM10011511_28680 [Puia dinghuensis]
MALAHRVEHSVAKHDSTILNRIFDEKALSQRVSDASSMFMNHNLIAGAVKGVAQGGLGSKVVRAIGDEGTYQLIKQYEKDGLQHILFRLYGNEGVNYHDFELVKRDEGIKAADLYIYTTGENISKTLADALKRLNSNGTNKDLKKTDNIKQLIEQGEYEQANTVYETLPAELKKEKAFQLMHIRIFSHFSTDRYIGALREYKSLFPHDPNMYLLMVDAYSLQKDYPKALESVNKLDSLIDKDPFQDYERGLIYKMMKDTVNELICFERLHKNMPEFKKGTYELINLYFSMAEPVKGAALIKEMNDTATAK